MGRLEVDVRCELLPRAWKLLVNQSRSMKATRHLRANKFRHLIGVHMWVKPPRVMSHKLESFRSVHVMPRFKRVFMNLHKGKPLS